MKLSEKIKKISPSPTLVITQKASELKKSGVDIVSFGAGEPDFDTPALIREAAKNAIDAGYTRYAPVAGMPELRSAICRYLQKTYGVSYDPEDIIVTCGAKSAIFIALEVLLDPGDEVIIPAPYWVSYPDEVILAGGKPVILETTEENKFKLELSALQRAVSNRTKILILNSPSNPTGSVYSKNELGEIIELCASKNITVIADEIYDRLVYEGDFCPAICAHPKAKENVIYINGVSKSFAMTGWRMGYAAAPKDVIKAMSKYQSQLLTSITTFVQKASVSAFEAPSSIVDNMLLEFKKRRDLIMRLVGEIPGVSAPNPAGAFYVFVNIKSYFGKSYNGRQINSSTNLAEFLLDEAGVAVVPGQAFGMEGFIRLSFATSPEEIKKGLGRIKDALKNLGGGQ